LIKANLVLEFNDALFVPSIFDIILQGKKPADPKTMPPRPTAYTGDTFLPSTVAGVTTP